MKLMCGPTQIAFIGILAAITVLPVGAYVAEGARSLRIYTRDSEDAGAKQISTSLFSTLAKKPIDLTASLTLNAAISLKTEKRAALRDMLPLDVSSVGLPAAGKSGGGWRAMGKAYGWLPAPRSEKLVISFSSSALTAQALTEFDELWIDYRNLLARAPASLSAQISAETRDYKGGPPRPFTVAAGQAVLFATTSLEPGKAAWLPKSSAYSLGRYLRRKSDDKWRYVGLNDMTVIQRRLHTEITSLEYMDLVFAPGSEPVGVNVRLAGKDNYSSGVMLELGALPAVPSPYGTHWRLHLPPLLMDRFAGKDRAFLQEIIVFVKGAPASVASTRPLEQIVFQKLDQQANPVETEIRPDQGKIRLETLPVSFADLDGSITRMIVDLRSLRSRGEVFFKSGKIILTPGNSPAPSSIVIDSARLVSFGDVTVPAYYRHGEDMLSRWGGNNLTPLSTEGGASWPVVRAYFPFTVLNPKLPEPKPVQDLSRSQREKKVQAQSANPLEQAGSPSPFVLRKKFQEDERRLFNRDWADVPPEDRTRMTVSDRGVIFFADRPFFKVTAESGGLALEGAGRFLQFSLPLTAEVNAETRVFLAMPEGAEKIASARLTAVFEDGEFDLHISPNRPAALGRAGRLRSLRFKFILAGGQYRLKFNELALFNPVLVEGSRAFALKLPIESAEAPAAVGISAPAGALTWAAGGFVRGSLAAGHSGSAVLSWQAPARRPIDWFKGAWLEYRVPAITAALNPCWLNLTLTGDKAVIKADLCPRGAAGRIFVRPSALSGRDIGKFIAADYKIDLGDMGPSPDKSFKFGMSYEGYAMNSVADAFADWPVARAGDADIGFIKNGNIAEKRIWLAGGPDAMSKLAAAGQLTPVEHPWFQVDSVAVEPLETLPQKAWDALTFRPAPAPERGILFKLLKLALYAGAIALAWRAGRKVKWSIFGDLAGSVLGSMMALAAATAVAVWGKVRVYLPAANKVVLLAALGPGLWYAAGLGGPATGAVSAFFLVIATGAYWHIRNNSGQVNEGWWFSGGGCLPPFLKFLGTAAALLAVWTLGRARLVPDARWNLLPTLAVVYFFLPWLAANTMVKVKGVAGALRQRKSYAFAALWGAVAFALYAAGLWRPVAAGENYYFTFGALAVTFTLRYLVALLLPIIGRFNAELAEDIGGAPAKPYFAAAILGLVATAVLTAAGLQPIAEQAAIAVYYGLVIGVIKEGVELYRTRSRESASGV